MRDGAVRVWAFPSATMPYWAETDDCKKTQQKQTNNNQTTKQPTNQPTNQPTKQTNNNKQTTTTTNNNKHILKPVKRL